MMSHQSISAKARSPWTDERIALLKQLHADKASCAVIAADINQKTGSTFTRNAVIGMCRRIKLSYRGPGFHNQNETRSLKRRPVAKVVKKEKPRTSILASITANPDVNSKHILLAELNSKNCHWPFGDEPPFTFCGCDVVSGPYCFAHTLLGTEPRRKRSATKVLEREAA